MCTKSEAMRQPIFSFNLHIRQVHDWPKTLDRLVQWNPEWLFVYVDEVDNRYQHRMGELRHRLPDTRFMIRHYHPHDGAFHLGAMSPSEFWDNYAHLLEPGDVLNVMNEPTGYGNAESLVAWLSALSDLAPDAELSWPAFGTGHPRDETIDGHSLWASEYNALIRLTNRTHNTLNLHEYRPGQGYRVGRFSWLIKRAQALGEPVPPFFITEYGWDNYPDGEDVDGYRARGISGRDFVGHILDDHMRWYMPAYVAGYLRAVFLFCLGNSGGWENFDVQNDDDFWDALFEYRDHFLPPYQEERPKPPVTTFDPDDWVLKLYAPQTNATNIRTYPETDPRTRVIAQLRDQQPVYVLRRTLNKIWHWAHFPELEVTGYIHSAWVVPEDAPPEKKETWRDKLIGEDGTRQTISEIAHLAATKWSGKDAVAGESLYLYIHDLENMLDALSGAEPPDYPDHIPYPPEN